MEIIFNKDHMESQEPIIKIFTDNLEEKKAIVNWLFNGAPLNLGPCDHVSPGGLFKTELEKD